MREREGNSMGEREGNSMSERGELHERERGTPWRETVRESEGEGDVEGNDESQI